MQGGDDENDKDDNTNLYIGLGVFLLMCAAYWFVFIKEDENTGNGKNNGNNPEPSIKWQTPPGAYPLTLTHSKKSDVYGKPYDMTCPGDSYVSAVNSFNGAFAMPVIRCSDGTELSYNTERSWANVDRRNTEEYPNGMQTIKYKYNTPGGLSAMTSIFGKAPDSKIFTCPSGTKFVGMRGDSGRFLGTAEFGCR